MNGAGSLLVEQQQIVQLLRVGREERKQRYRIFYNLEYY
jgi:hypothetical protein